MEMRSKLTKSHSHLEATENGSPSVPGAGAQLTFKQRDVDCCSLFPATAEQELQRHNVHHMHAVYYSKQEVRETCVHKTSSQVVLSSEGFHGSFRSSSVQTSTQTPTSFI